MVYMKEGWFPDFLLSFASFLIELLYCKAWPIALHICSKRDPKFVQLVYNGGINELQIPDLSDTRSTDYIQWIPSLKHVLSEAGISTCYLAKTSHFWRSFSLLQRFPMPAYLPRFSLSLHSFLILFNLVWPNMHLAFASLCHSSCGCIGFWYPNIRSNIVKLNGLSI